MRKFVLFLVVYLIIPNGYSLAKQSDPMDALNGAAQAWAKHDLKSFEGWVDIQSMTDMAVSDYTKWAMNPARDAMERTETVALLLLRSNLAQELASEIRKAVMTGQAEIPGVEPSQFNLHQLVSGAAGDPGKLFFRGMTGLTGNGDSARAVFEAYHPGYDLPLVLELDMTRQGDAWKIVRWANLPQVMDAMDAKLVANAKRMNDPEYAAGYVSLEQIERFWVRNLDGSRLFVIRGMAVNRYNAPLSNIKVEGRIYDESENILVYSRMACGSMLTDSELEKLSPDQISDLLVDGPGTRMNSVISPGQGVPFMVVFHNPPEQMRKSGIRPAEASPSPAMP